MEHVSAYQPAHPLPCLEVFLTKRAHPLVTFIIVRDDFEVSTGPTLVRISHGRGNILNRSGGLPSVPIIVAGREDVVPRERCEPDRLRHSPKRVFSFWRLLRRTDGCGRCSNSP